MKCKELLIVILNYVDFNITIDCVKNLRNYGIKEDIIVVDNNSPNESYDRILESIGFLENVRVIKTNKNGGYSFGNNFAINYVERENYKYYCIMNPDIVVKNPNYFIEITNIMDRDPKIALASGVQIYSGLYGGNFMNYWKLPNKISGIYDHSFIDIFHKRKQKPIAILDDYGYVDVLSGCCFVVRSDVFNTLNYFDENVFLYYEENILSKKIHNAGYKEALCINLSFYHNHKIAPKKLKKILKNKIIQISSKKYFYKNYVTSSAILHLMCDLFSFIDILLNYVFYGIYTMLRSFIRKR